MVSVAEAGKSRPAAKDTLWACAAPDMSSAEATASNAIFRDLNSDCVFMMFVFRELPELTLKLR